jgi:hypothetical protein
MADVTRTSKKTFERVFVDHAARLLGRSWITGDVDREEPDFIVSEGNWQFGLEVTQIFVGAKEVGGGSFAKWTESANQRAMNELRKQYEASTGGIVLDVQINNLNNADVAPIVRALIAEDFASKPDFHRFCIDLGDGLIVHARKGGRGDWISLGDRVGWVTRDSSSIISERVSQKALKLPAYQAAVGNDVRLLVVADRIMNSGKLDLEGSHDLELHGFRAVYFCSYPETVTTFGDG